MSVTQTMDYISLLKNIEEEKSPSRVRHKRMKSPKAKPKRIYGAYPGAGVTDDQGSYAWVDLVYSLKAFTKPMLMKYLAWVSLHLQEIENCCS